MNAGFHGGLTDQPAGMWHKPRRKHLVRLVQERDEELRSLRVELSEMREERNRYERGWRKLNEARQ